MNSQQLTNVVQIATGIAVLVGLLLVLYELRQAKSLTLAELTSEGYAEVMEDYRNIMGETSAAAIAKACYTPDEMTREELVILDSFFRGQIAHLARLRVLESVEEFGVPWQLFGRQQLEFIMSMEHGRWWAAENFAPDPELDAMRKDVLATRTDCGDYFGRFAARAEKSVADTTGP